MDNKTEIENIQKVVNLMKKLNVSGFLTTDRISSTVYQKQQHLLSLLNTAKIENNFLNILNQEELVNISEQRKIDPKKKEEDRVSYVG